MDDVLTSQVVESQCHLTDVQFDRFFRKLNVLLQVIAQVTAEKQVHHHEHVLLVLEGVPAGPAVREPGAGLTGVTDPGQERDLLPLLIPQLLCKLHTVPPPAQPGSGVTPF